MSPSLSLSHAALFQQYQYIVWAIYWEWLSARAVLGYLLGMRDERTPVCIQSHSFTVDECNCTMYNRFCCIIMNLLTVSFAGIV